MTKRPTTLVESDQLARAAANVLRNEDFVPKGSRWPFSRVSRAQREYDKAVQEVTARRREAREKALEQKTKEERAQADEVFEQALGRAQAEHAKEVAEAKKPRDAVEVEARAVRDAAITAANLAYEKSMEEADAILLQAAEAIDEKRDAELADATAAHDAAYAAIDEAQKTSLAQIAGDLKTIPLEGPMRIVEDRQVWTAAERKKALVGIVDMVGQDELDAEFAELCLRTVTRYALQDRFLAPNAEQHRVMDVGLLEALVDLARRTPRRRPAIVGSIHGIVKQNPGYTSAKFIKTLAELYLAASADATTVYHEDPAQNEAVFDGMREHLADVLKLTPRRSQVSPPQAGDAAASRDAAPDSAHDQQPKDVQVANDHSESDQDPDDRDPTRKLWLQDAEITADVALEDLLPLESTDGLFFASDAREAEAIPSSVEPPPVPQPAAPRDKSSTSSEDSNA